MDSKEKFFDSRENEKQKLWEEAACRTEIIVDKLGKHIDQNIKDAVTVFKVLNINTTASCEGHFGHGTYAPYIDIEAKEVRNLDEFLKKTQNEEEAKSIIEEIKRKNLEERKKVMSYLDEFYENRKTPFHKRLVIQGMARGWSRLESQGVDLQKIEPKEVRQERLLEYQEEMTDFTSFLKQKYFIEKTLN